MKFKCNNQNLTMKNLVTGFAHKMPTDVHATFVKFTRDKAIISIGNDKYILDRFMFEQWFEKV